MNRLPVRLSRGPDVLTDRDPLRDFGPLAERAVSVDEESMIRFRSTDAAIAGFVRLPLRGAGRTHAGYRNDGR